MRNAFVKLHLSIVLAGFTGIFGKLIQLPEGPLVWYRMLMASVLFFFYLLVAGNLPRIPVREVCKICGVGALIALHWMFFYGSVKYANVSIAVVCFALAGFFTAILEPLFGRTKLSPRELLFSLLTVAGIALIFHFDTHYRTGIILGVISAVFAALFTIAMRRVGKSHDSTTMLLFQMVGGLHAGRSLLHLSEVVRLAAAANALEEPGLAAERWHALLGLNGLDPAKAVAA